MKTKILVSVIVSTVLLLVPCAFAQGAKPDRDALVKFQNALKQDGFDVTPGAAEVWDPLGSWCADDLPNARLVNSGPNLVLTVPKEVPKPGEKPDLIPTFRIRHDEAIVLIGRTPPPARYFGFYTFIATRFYPGKEEETEILSTLGDAVNHATIKTTGPTPFDAPVVLIFTPDRGTDAGIRAALRRAGYPGAIINTNVLPASMLNLGHGETADEFQINLRTALFEDPDAGNRYMTDAPRNLHILRVTPRPPAIADPFPMPPLRVRGTGESELRLMNKLGELRTGIIAANAGLYATDFLSAIATYEDYDFLQRAKWADLGTRDAFVLSAGWMMPVSYLNDVITLADDEFLMVYGVNHFATLKTTYMNINFYATGREVNGEPVEEANAFVGGVSDKDLPGTATDYLPAGDPDAKLMYAYKVSRSCGEDEPNCLPLSAPCTRVTLASSTV
ncbi:MAG TPA: hypothetical protein VLE22_02185, partial [Bryobacteraceae bacterium]|nr:hypothetical protein [Bryobacteraceae bacterium]